MLHSFILCHVYNCVCVCVCVWVGGCVWANFSSLNESSRLGEICRSGVGIRISREEDTKEDIIWKLTTCINLHVAHHRYTHTTVMKPYAYMHWHIKYQSSKPLCVLPSSPLW